jgi:hypothetical protein
MCFIDIHTSTIISNILSDCGYYVDDLPSPCGFLPETVDTESEALFALSVSLERLPEAFALASVACLGDITNGSSPSDLCGMSST